MPLSQPRPLKSLEPSTLNYRRINEAIGDAAFARSEASQLRYRTGRADPFSAALFHPFKLYQLPPMYRDGTSADDWLKFRVRAGRVLGTDAAGTDGQDADPDAEVYVPGAADITLPSGAAKFWFWLEFGAGGSGAIVRYGTDPTAASYSTAWMSINPWTVAPVPDSQHVPIGWVDTSTDTGNHNAIVRQLLREDVVTVGGGSGYTEGVFRFKSMEAEYLVCRATTDGSTDGGTDIYVAKPYKLRWSAPNVTIDGQAVTYANYDLTSQKREATCQSVMAKEAITPRYVLNDLVWANQPGITLVTVSGTGLIWMDLNRDGRAWAKKNDQS
jgi:hypothetical protein